MQSVRTKNTGPEVKVRQLLHAMGYRFRLHRRDLPGTPDIVFPKKRKVIFVNGCFWHGHNCSKGQLPKSRIDYWKDKIDRNCERDKKNSDELAELGWKTLTLWQCELVDMHLLSNRISAFLEN
jgi:DNA mismatch endonuclease (patch repair protein)